MKWRRILFLSFGHFASDFYPGILPALLPLINERLGWSTTKLGILVTVMMFFGNASQPVIGIFNDRYPLRSFLWAGPLVSAIPFAFLLTMCNYHMMILLLAVAGFGVAMYHPVAAVAAGLNADEKRRGVSMALFSSGGSIGVTFAPLFMILITSSGGERYMPLIVLPAVVMGIYFYRDRSIAVSEHHGVDIQKMFTSIKVNRIELTLLWLVSAFRAIVYTLVQSFLPMLVIARGASYATSNLFLSGTLLAGMVGMFIGGHLSDKHGRRRIMALTMVIATPLLYGFLHTSGVLSIIMLVIGMAAMSSTIPVNIILAQSAAPRLAGMASSLVMGASFMLGALAATPFGALADSIGIEQAMHVIFIFPLLGGITVLFLRKE